MPIARTPLHAWHAAHGAVFAERDGWQTVSAYSATEAVPTGLALVDVSACAKFSLRGSGVADFARTLAPDSAALKPRGVANVSGRPTIAGDGTLVCRLSEEHLLLLFPGTMTIEWAERLRTFTEVAPAGIIDVTSAFASFWLLGPEPDQCLRKLTSLDLCSALPPGSCAETSLAGVEALLARTNELSVPSIRIVVAADLGEYVWDRLREAGKDRQITAIGLQTLNTLRAGK